MSRGILQRGTLWQAQRLSQRDDPFIQSRNIPCALGLLSLIQRQLGMFEHLGCVPLVTGDFCFSGMFHRLIDVSIEERALLSQSGILVPVPHDRRLLVGVAKRVGRSGDKCPTDNQSRAECQYLACVHDLLLYRNEKFLSDPSLSP